MTDVGCFLYIYLEIGNFMFDGSPLLQVSISSRIIEVGYDVIKAIGQYLELRIICLYFLDFESDHCFGI